MTIRHRTAHGQFHQLKSKTKTAIARQFILFDTSFILGLDKKGLENPVAL